MRIGAQVPLAGGLLAAVQYAAEVGCETIQIFAKSPRRWDAPPQDEAAAARFRIACAEADIGPVFSHASYLINLGAEDPLQWEKSWLAIADELDRASILGAAGVVMHLGRRFDDDTGRCVARVLETVMRAYDATTGVEVPLLLENTAGAGRQFGIDASELARTLNALRAEGVPAALCIDTCHALAAGIDVARPAGWAGLLDELDDECGPGCVALIHANDSMGAIGEHRDRHEWIGDGNVGVQGFAAMFAQSRLHDCPTVVEMPGEKPVKDAENIKRLKLLRDGGAALASPARARGEDAPRSPLRP